MIKKDAERFDDFIEHVADSTTFSPWLDEYDPFTETGVAFVHGGDEDNGQFGIGDIDLNFGKVEFTYQDVLNKVKAYCDNCKSRLGKRAPQKEMSYVSEVEELVDVIQDWCDGIDESKQDESRPSYYDHPLIMAITYKGSTIYCGTEDGDMWSNDIEDAYVWNSFDTVSTIAVENFVAVAKEALETRWISEDNVEYLPAPTDTDESKKSEGFNDYKAIEEWLEGVMDKADTLFTKVYASANRKGEIAVEIEGWDSTDGDCIVTLVFNEGEDFEETIGNLASDLEDYVDGFDPEEEAELEKDTPGAPSLRRLLAAMDERKEDMRKLSDAVNAAYRKM